MRIKMICFVLDPYPAVFQAYSYLCAQESLLAVFREPYRVPEIELWSAVCKASTLFAVLLLCPLK